MAHINLKKLFRIIRGDTRVIVRTRRRRVGVLTSSARSYKAKKEEARALVHRKLLVLNVHYQLNWGKVAIRNQRSRWGSCSKKGNLNFNFRILLLPEPLQDYIIAHELCHLAVFDHSKKFWARVAETIPDHIVRRKELTRIARTDLLARVSPINLS